MAKKKKRKNKSPLPVQPSSWAERKPIFRFVGLFLLGCILFYAMSGMAWFESIRSPLLHFFASISALLLKIGDTSVAAVGETLSSPKFTVEIKEGCDAIAPMALFCLSVLIYPVAWDRRIRGIIIGIALLMTLNIVRIISLYLTGVYAPSWFDFMHVDFWQAGFILFTVFLWIYWMRWAVKSNTDTI